MPNKQQIVEFYKTIHQSLVAFVTAVFKLALKPARFHFWFSDMLLKRSNNVAIEAFRESGKTTYVVYGFPLYSLTFPQSNRSYIVLIKASDELAKQKVKEIRDLYLENKILSANVQKVYQQGETLDVLTKEGIRVRIEGYGKGMNIRGLNWQSRRPDIVILDDVQTLDDVRSSTIADRDWEWFLSDVYMLSKQSRIFMIGNNLGDRCIIERLSKNAKEFGFEFYRIPAIKNGRSVWSEKFSLEFLKKEREAYARSGKLDVWERERMCQSVGSETQVFKKSMFRYYTRLPDGILRYYTAVDLAVSQKEKSDYTVVLTLAINTDNRRFIVDVAYGRFTLDETVKRIFEHVEKYNPAEVVVETVAYQAVLEQILQKEMFRTGIFFNIKPYKPQGKKEMRIMALQPLYAAGAVYHKQDADWLTELEEELLMFTEDGTKSEHDDLIDALASANYHAKAPAKRRVGSRLQRIARRA